MKTINAPLILMLTASLVACDTNMENIISAEDLAAIRAMETAYTMADIYNDSLVAYIDDTGIENDATCFYYDSAFHHYDSLFEHNHKKYSHMNSGDDHGSGDWGMGSGWMHGNSGMHGNGGMHGGNNSSGHHGFNSNNCTGDNLALMDSLMANHEPYHVGN